MTANLGLHMLQFPSGRWGYVGSVPTCLGTTRPATASDVTGGRAFYDSAGDIVTWEFPTFDTEAEAREFAARAGAGMFLPGGG